MFRNKIVVVIIIALVFVSLAGISFTKGKRDSNCELALQNYLVKYSGEMLAALGEFKKHIPDSSSLDSMHVEILKQYFLQCRMAYKKMEPLSCYYFSSSERNFNGPLVPEIEDEEESNPPVEYPHGLQQMEAYLWDDEPKKFRKELLDEIDLMNGNLSSINISSKTMRTTEDRFFEAVQLQVIRTFTMGITQFDTPECKNAMGETHVSLQSLIEILNSAYQKEITNRYMADALKQLNKTLLFFNKVHSIEEIDFLLVLRDYYIPLSKSLAAARENFVEHFLPENNFHPASAIRFTKSSLFETDAFNTYFYNPRGTDLGFSKDASELGKTLFFDPVMSENNKRACASCHQPEKAFTDNAKTSTGFHTGEKVLRNAPTIINAALQRNYFFDNRADNLEGQIGHVLTNAKEMKSNFDELISKLNSSPEYVEWFKRAFAGTEDTVISKTSIVNAIAEYERKLVSLNSKFDKNVRGNEKSFSKEEKNGFNVFMNKGRCATCHYLPLFNNVVPPQYTKSEWEIIGTTESNDTLHPKLDSDPGRGGLYGKKIFMNAFKTPTLRNISLTAPYMHNGIFPSLEEVVRFYDVGGGAGMHLDVPNQTLSSDSLHLSEKEKKSLVAFLKTLTDTTNLTSVPARLPVFPNSSSLNERKIGGEY